MRKLSRLSFIFVLAGCNSQALHVSENRRSTSKFLLLLNKPGAKKLMGLNLGDVSHGNFVSATVGIACPQEGDPKVTWLKNVEVTALGVDQEVTGFSCQVSPLAAIISVTLSDSAGQTVFSIDKATQFNLNSMEDLKSQVKVGKSYLMSEASGANASGTSASNQPRRVGQVAISVLNQFENVGNARAEFQINSGLAAAMIAKGIKIPDQGGTTVGTTSTTGDSSSSTSATGGTTTTTSSTTSSTSTTGSSGGTTSTTGVNTTSSTSASGGTTTSSTGTAPSTLGTALVKYIDGLGLKIENFVITGTTSTLTFSSRYLPTFVPPTLESSIYWSGKIAGNLSSGLPDADGQNLLVRYNSGTCSDTADYTALVQDLAQSSDSYVDFFETVPPAVGASPMNVAVKLRAIRPGSDGIGTISFNTPTIAPDSCLMIAAPSSDSVSIMYTVLRFKS